MNKGWIKLHRQVLNNADLMIDTVALAIFVTLLLKASPKGEILITSRELANLLGLEHTTVFRATKRLEKYGITQQTTQHRKTLIRICKWSQYQSTTQQGTQHPRNTGATQTQHPPRSVRIENKNKEEHNVLKKENTISEIGLATLKAKRLENGV